MKKRRGRIKKIIRRGVGAKKTSHTLSRSTRKRRKKIVRMRITFSVILVILALGTLKLFLGDSVSEVERDEVKIASNKSDEAKVVVEPKKDGPNDLVKGSNIIHSANEYAIEMSTVQQIVSNKYTGTDKYVFLTFDDGPSPNTEKILNILKEKGVHATFFVVGKRLENSGADEYLKRELKEGHAIANHTYTHSLEKLYPNNQVNPQYFLEEYDKTNNRMKEILGKDFDSKVLRMPGGQMSRRYYNDPQLPSFDAELAKRGVVSIDWDSMNGDAEGREYTPQEMVQKVTNKVQNLNQTVVLMHDTFGKEKTVEALPAIIDYFKNNGWEFKVIKSTVAKN